MQAQAAAVFPITAARNSFLSARSQLGLRLTRSIQNSQLFVLHKRLHIFQTAVKTVGSRLVLLCSNPRATADHKEEAKSEERHLEIEGDNNALRYLNLAVGPVILPGFDPEWRRLETRSEIAGH